MKTFLSYIGKALLTLVLSLVFIFIYYAAIYGLFYIQYSDTNPSREMIVEITRGSMTAALNVFISLLYPTILLVWSKRKSIFYRLKFLVLFSGASTLVMYFISSSIIAIILLPVIAMLYNKILNRK